MKKILFMLILVPLALLNAITLEDAQTIGLKNNLAYKNSKNSKKGATASKLKAYSAILPTATANGSHSTSYAADNTDMDEKRYSLNLRQPLFQSGAIIYGMKIAGSQEKIAKNNLVKAKISLLAEVEKKYFTVLEAKQLLNVAKKKLRRANLQFSNAETRHQLGAISNSDFMQFQLEKSQSEVALFSAEKQYNTVLKDFNNYLNTNKLEPEDIVTLGPLKEAGRLAELGITKIEEISSKLHTKAVYQNLDLRNMTETVNTAKSYLRLSQTAFLPSIDFSVTQNWVNSDRTDGWDDSYTYGLNFSLPVFPLIDKGFSYQTKKYEYRNSSNNQKDAENKITLQTETAWLDLVTSAKNLTATQISLNYANSLYEQSSLEFEQGELSATNYVAASISLANAQNQYYSAIYGYLQKKSALNKLLCEQDYAVLDKIIFGGAE